MRNVLLSALSLSFLFACSAPVSELEEQGGSASKQERPTNPNHRNPMRVVDVPVGRVHSTSILKYESYYNDTDPMGQMCGGDFKVDISVQFGEVTPTTMFVKSVTATFHSGVDIEGKPNQVVPVNFVIESGSETGWTSPPDWLPKANNRTVVYRVNQKFTLLDVGQPLTLLFLASTGTPGGDSGDTCINTFRSQYLPQED